MLKFVIDEDMPRSTGKILKEQGYGVKDIRDFGLRGADDQEIYQVAQREQAILITGDMESELRIFQRAPFVSWISS